MNDPSCRLPDGRGLAIQGQAGALVCCGVAVLADAHAGAAGGAAAATERLARDLRARWAGLSPGQIPPLAEARDLYKAFGMDPSRHRPSSEALLRRVLKGEDLYRINDAVDACNLASLSFLLPIGLYDLAAVRGDVTVRRGGPGEAYPGIRKGPVHLQGRLGLFDEAGPFGSPTSDSARTCVGEGTTDILAVVMATAAYPAAAMARNLDVLCAVFKEHCATREAFRAVLGGRQDA